LSAFPLIFFRGHFAHSLHTKIGLFPLELRDNLDN